MTLATGRRGARARIVLFPALALALALQGPARAAATFTLQVLPGDRPDEALAWHDVNGDGRNDLIRQANRWLEVYFLDARHRLSPTPDWRVKLATPWDLWDFADVRPELPGEELLALSPNGVGWTSWQRHTTSTAQMELLLPTPLPVTPDPRQARPGQFVVRRAKDLPQEFLLPTRSTLQFWRRDAADRPWRVVEEVPALLRPRPLFRTGANDEYLVGFDRFPFSPDARALSPVVPGRLAWRDFRFRLSWAAQGGWLMDWNHDGRLDWAATAGATTGGLRIFLQTPEGRFDREHPLAPLWPPAPSPDEEQRKNPRRFRRRPESGASIPADLAASEFANLADVDGDGRLDVIRISSFDNWASPKTTVAVFLQRPDGTYPREPDSTLRAGAVLPTEVLPLVDVNGDGALDLLLLRLDLQIASLNSHMKAFVRRGLETYLGPHLWVKGSGFAKRPAWEKQILIGHDLFEFSRDPQPLMEFDRDFTGDGRPDLVLRLTRNTIGVFALDPRRGFATDPLATLAVPFALEKIECDDFDGDGLTDIRVEGWDPENHERVPRAVFFGEK